MPVTASVSGNLQIVSIEEKTGWETTKKLMIWIKRY